MQISSPLGSLSLFLYLTLLTPLLLAASDYDPAKVLGKVETELASFHYDEREVPLKFYLPAKQVGPAPIILLSHGLGGSREVGNYLGQQWAGRGYVVVAMQHLGSDESVWEDAPIGQRRRILTQAANGATFQDRMKDVPATLDQLEKWNQDSKHPLHKRVDFGKVGIAGHSYGAVTAQALGGQQFGPLGPLYRDPRIDAVVALSPSPPKRGDAQVAFAEFELPALLMTGTKDGDSVGRTTPERRREVYSAMPAGGKYHLVLKDAEHSAFSDHLDHKRAEHNPNHHAVILALSSAFWDCHLFDREEAREWLASSSPYKLLEEGDLWQTK